MAFWCSSNSQIIPKNSNHKQSQPSCMWKDEKWPNSAFNLQNLRQKNEKWNGINWIFTVSCFVRKNYIASKNTFLTHLNTWLRFTNFTQRQSSALNLSQEIDNKYISTFLIYPGKKCFHFNASLLVRFISLFF